MSDTTDRSHLAALVETLAGAKVLCVGDVMLDHFQYGTVERISPEAPVPVLRVEREDAMLGGAGNVVRNLVSLGAEARFVSVVGDDEAGREVARQFADEGLTDAPIIDGGRRTSTKTRYIAGAQQMLRADHESPFSLTDEVEADVIAQATAALETCGAVILSDYNKGVLTDDALAELIGKATGAGVAVIVDPKGSNYAQYAGATVVTPNRHELSQATGLPTGDANQVESAAWSLIDAHGFGAVLATRGGAGMTLVTKSGDVHHLGAEAREVFDVSGAGDTVAATMAAALSAGVSLADAAAIANVAAGIVVGKLGTAKVTTGEVLAALHHQDLSSAEAKVLARGEVAERVADWRRREFSVGFTNGVFDLLHPGHVSLLGQAKANCDRLVVGLNSDASVRRLKGDDRPVQAEAARAAVVASLAVVDAVVVFDEDTPLELIQLLKPDVLVKGADYALADVVGADVVQAGGGKVVLADLQEGHSTTATIARMGNGNGC